MTRHSRNWCAKATFGRGHEEFLFGTVQADSELMAERLLTEAWKSICPHPVTITAVIPGTLSFEGE